MKMNIDDLTIGQAKELANLFANKTCDVEASDVDHKPQQVLVCTDKRGVVYGTTHNPNARPITLFNARMCLYWSADVGGVFGLAENGPTKDCKISAQVSEITLEGVTAVFSCDEAAQAAWAKAKVQGR
jgi:hypothetical protein